MSEKLSDQNVRLKLNFRDFELSVEASESFVRHDLRDCLNEISEANIFDSLERTPIQLEGANTIKPTDGVVLGDVHPQPEYSMNSTVNLLFGASGVSVSKVIQAAFFWLETAEDNITPSFDEVRGCFVTADDHLSDSQVRNFKRDFGEMKKAGKIRELTGGKCKLDPKLLEDLRLRFADAG